MAAAFSGEEHISPSTSLWKMNSYAARLRLPRVLSFPLPVSPFPPLMALQREDAGFKLESLVLLQQGCYWQLLSCPYID